jgi:hypothetical protein
LSTTAPLDATLARLSPEARRLLWILTRAETPVPESLVEKVWGGESVTDERLRQFGRMIAAFERMPPESRPDAPPVTDEMRKKIAALDASAAERPDMEPFVGELVEARLVSHAPLVEGSQAMGFSVNEEAAEAAARWMDTHPDDRRGQDDVAVRVAFGERYGAAFVAAVEGKIPGGTAEAGIDAGTQAARYFLAAGAMEPFAEIVGEAVRAANDAAIVGPVVFAVEKAGALDALLEAFVKKNDTLGEAGTLAALAGYRSDNGEIDKAIELEVRSLAPLARLENVVPRAIVHLRLSSLLELATCQDESATHLAAALLYRALAGVDIGAELRVLVTRLGRDGDYLLPSVRAMVEDPAFADLARFVTESGVPLGDVQADLDSLVAQVKQHISK